MICCALMSRDIILKEVSLKWLSILVTDKLELLFKLLEISCFSLKVQTVITVTEALNSGKGL